MPYEETITLNPILFFVVKLCPKQLDTAIGHRCHKPSVRWLSSGRGERRMG